MEVSTAVVVIITLAWAVSGGVHDAGTLTASGIASRALTPRSALAIVGVFGFLGPLAAGTAVAGTVGSFVELDGLAPSAALLTITVGLMAAIAWNTMTWWVGIPASSTHGLVGGLVGATVVAAGPDHVVWGVTALAEGRVVGVTKVLLALLLSPIIGLLLGIVVLRAAAWSLRSAGTTWNRRLRSAQIPTVAALSFAHGANEAQKGMGIIALALMVGSGGTQLDVPAWAVLACAATIPAGALAGGWRIVRTLGYGVYQLRPLHAAGAQMTAATVVGVTSVWGGPVSTSQVTSSAIMGVGAAERPRDVRWATGKAIMLAWLLTVPATAALAMMGAGVLRGFGAL